MEKILVVDDERDNLTILELYLKQRGFETVLCNSALKAIEVAEKENPDLIILDVMMPEMDGFTVCKNLKGNSATSEIPVIFLTARYLDKKDLIQGLSLGAFDYITKPFDEGELFARISVALKVRKAEQSLKKQRDFLDAILNSVGNDLIILTPDFTIDMANKSFLNKRGLNESDAAGKPCCQISFGKKKCFEKSEDCPTDSAFKGVSLKRILELQDGMTAEKKFVNISAFPIISESGRIERVVEIHEDITKEIKRENERKRANLMLESILLQMSEGLVFLSNEREIILQNRKAKRLIDEFGVCSDGRLISIGDLSFESIMKAHITEGETKTISHTTGLGDEFYKFNSTMVQAKDSSGLIVTVDDITTEIKTQEELLQSAKLVSIGELAASIAHEINNPITGIIGYSELLNLYKEVLPPKVIEITEKMMRESYRVKNIIENLLKFSRRQQAMDMAYVDIGVSLKEIAHLLSASFRENNIEFSMNIAEDIPLIHCNSGLIQQAVLNLLQNAFDAIVSSQKGTKISLDVSMSDGKLVTKVEDDGPGIPGNVRDKIFEPFFTTKTKGKGTGLGLSLIHRIVQVHNGQIECDTSGSGTTFIMKLPVSVPESVQKHIKSDTPFVTQNFGKALIIDDDSVIKEYLSDILYTFKFKVDEAKDAKEGEQLLRHNDYDVVLLDIKLPDKDGFDIFYELAAVQPSKTDKVIFITGDISIDTRERLKKTGRPFLIKPFSFNDLIKIIGLK